MFLLYFIYFWKRENSFVESTFNQNVIWGRIHSSIFFIVFMKLWYIMIIWGFLFNILLREYEGGSVVFYPIQLLAFRGFFFTLCNVHMASYRHKVHLCWKKYSWNIGNWTWKSLGELQKTGQFLIGASIHERYCHCLKFSMFGVRKLK